ncbi:hypothetical protein [Streptomyces cucumeris]|uniref:hypothetical protein n=1 Tax=Streptomyces cucumeris TaxID=2962890 RepID=UPI0020C9142A|nr:hypothetical protein [Streptomyces sp. NEAU-Y11]MCP9213324.1 hypothetical protein [Streptomyces sp. NEAU-Y11]
MKRRLGRSSLIAALLSLAAVSQVSVLPAAATTKTTSAITASELPAIPTGPTDDQEVSPSESGAISREGGPESCDSIERHFDTLAASGVTEVACTDPVTEEEAAQEVQESTKSPNAAAAPRTRCPASERGKGLIFGSRRYACFETYFNMSVRDTRTRRVTGTAKFLFQQDWNLEKSDTTSKHPKFTEYFAVTLVKATGTARKVNVKFTAECPKCWVPGGGSTEISPVKGNLTQGKYLQADWSRWVDLSTKLRKSVGFRWSLQPVFPGVRTPPPYGWTHDPKIVPVRCDHEVGAYYGCVVPDMTPVLNLKYETYKAAAMFVFVSQTLNKHHWGLRGKGKPLKRLADRVKQEENRDIICDNTFQGDFHAPGPISCDEFPFAATRQSGATVGVQSGKECEQMTTRKKANGDYDVYIVDDNADENALCTRATTPEDQNEAVGGALGSFYQTARVLDKEAFYVHVYKDAL